ncbi:MAG: DUF2278 family protein, partial [Beijerinckiaceae bacterium]|nr:DUF2278 family protein [Beijerinckiaceae bacterium]
HYQIHLVDDASDWRVAVNVQSKDGSEVHYAVVPRFRHPILSALEPLPLGFHAIASAPGGLALDFIRANLADPRDFVPLPVSAPGPDNDLNEKIDAYAQRALADEQALIFAFGEPWGPEQKADRYFRFKPGRGIHDIHMNQGNPPGAHADSNGTWQDGGLIFYFPNQNEWAGIFLKFLSQDWHTSDTTGDPLGLGAEVPPADRGDPGQIGKDEPPTLDKPDGLIRIVAALVNSKDSPEREIVTILNTSDRDVSLDGWHLADKMKNRMALGGTIAAGASLLVGAAAPFVLSNKGGIITLLDERGVKVDGVSYTRDQARLPGWTVVF